MRVSDIETELICQNVALTRTLASKCSGLSAARSPVCHSPPNQSWLQLPQLIDLRRRETTPRRSHRIQECECLQAAAKAVKPVVAT